MKIILPNGNIQDADSPLSIIRHSTSHILAQAVKRLYPETRLAIGPAVDDGFYYDFDRETGFSSEDLAALENEMAKIIKENLPIKPFILPKDQALKLMEERNEPYKMELIQDLPDDVPISFYQQGEFVDLCSGPHILYTKGIKAFKLTSVAGAYWRGNEHNKMLTRIYGTAFESKAELADHLHMIEEAKKRDHRKLGKELGLFLFTPEGPGFPFFLPKGLDVYKRQHLRRRKACKSVKRQHTVLQKPRLIRYTAQNIQQLFRLHEALPLVLQKRAVQHPHILKLGAKQRSVLGKADHLLKLKISNLILHQLRQNRLHL